MWLYVSYSSSFLYYSVHGLDCNLVCGCNHTYLALPGKGGLPPWIFPCLLSCQIAFSQFQRGYSWVLEGGGCYGLTHRVVCPQVSCRVCELRFPSPGSHPGSLLWSMVILSSCSANILTMFCLSFSCCLGEELVVARPSSMFVMLLSFLLLDVNF